MSTRPAITLSYPEPDIAELRIDVPDKGANVLSRSVLEELAGHLDVLEQRADLAGMVIISGKPGTFIAGADLREFAASLGAPKEEIVAMCRQGQTLFGRLSKTPFVTVAAIDGICLGGGSEMAVWCDRRVMSSGEKTELGFPEVKLGLYPGWGGTARLPRMVGLSNAVEMITGGESIDPPAARAMGLTGDVAPAEKLLETAIRRIRLDRQTGDYLRDRERWSGPLSLSGAELGFLGAAASAYIRGQTKGHYPAPEAALEAMLASAGRGIDAALKIEADGMARLFGSPVNAALLNVFFLTDRNKKDTGIDRPGVKARAIGSVGVIGTGIMGAGIAAASLRRDLHTMITDANPDALTRGARGVLEEVSYDKKAKGPTVERSVHYGALLHTTTSDGEIAACDLVIEAVVEQHDVKRQLYARIEPLLRPDAILASNTSSIPITKLAENLARPDKFCGIHFFNPVRKMRLVEVIRGERTSDETIATAVAYAKGLGKHPIVVNDGPGFLVNRMLFPYLNEALALVGEGAEFRAIDKAARAFGMPMGPIELYDLVGLDTALMAGRTSWEAFPDRIIPSPILPALVKAGRLGQKNGRGFFSYQNKKGTAEADPEVQRLIGDYIGEKRQHSAEEITARLFLPMLLEATRILAAGIVRDVRDVDLGLIFGLGFPPFKGGLLFWADTLGAEKILEMLAPYASNGHRMAPTPMLLDMAKTGKKFYG